MPRDNKPTSAIDMLICPAAGSGPQRVWTLGGVKQTTQHMGSARGDDSGMRQCLFNELHGIKRKISIFSQEGFCDRSRRFASIPAD